MMKWASKHPFMTFFLALAALGAVETIFGSSSKERQPLPPPPPQEY